MNDTEQRIAIAKACHWTDIDWETNYFVSRSTPSATLRGNNPNGNRWEVPDYLTDLNAMHEAEATLTGETNYYHQLLIRMNNYDGLATVRATAAQRAEAFLRTIGKWQETAPAQK